MKWILRYWVAIVVALVSIGSGVGLAHWSQVTANRSANKPTPTYDNTIEDLNNNVTTESNTITNKSAAPSTNNRTTGGGVSFPIPIPSNVAPWGTGASDQTSPSTGGSNNGSGSSLPSSEVPWGTGPSQ